MLPKSLIDKINESVDDVYKRIKARFLGTEYQKKGIEFRITNALEDFYRDISQREGVTEPNEDNIDTLKRVAESYLDASNSKAKAQVLNTVQGAIREAILTGEKQNIETALQGALSEVWGNATTHVHTILDSEINSTKNISIMDGIVQSNAAVGVEDPVVFFVIVRDGNVCKECVRLHMMPDGNTPRCWYLSEVGHGYHKKGEDNPKMGGLHPHCRCVMTTLMPGFGFNAAGRVTFIATGYSEIKNQRGLGKSEMEYAPHDCEHTSEELAKSTRKTIEEGLLNQILKHVDVAPHDLMTTNPLHKVYRNPYIMERNIRLSPLVVHFPASATQYILKDGRLKTQFDTGSTMGWYDPSVRAKVEERLFGIPKAYEGDYRPVYGTLHTGHSNKRGWVHGGPGVDYGNAWLELHPEVKKRSTFTAGDSLDTAPESPVIGRQSHAVTRAFGWKHTPQHCQFQEQIHPYLEAQIHGGVYLDKDVRAIHVIDPKAGQENLLKQMGMKYNVPVYSHEPTYAGKDLGSTKILYEPSDMQKKSAFDRKIRKRLKQPKP